MRDPMPRSPGPENRDPSRAFRFVLIVGILSLFADCVYEGSRSVTGPYLQTLGADALEVGFITGLGEFLGYALRLGSGRLADATGRYWIIIGVGYALQMISIPALALTDTWPAAAALIVLERVGKALRNPPRNALLADAGDHIGGYGYVFGLHELLDQTGAMLGPLLVSAVLALHGSYQVAFGVLVVPAIINLSLVGLARRAYPTTVTPAAYLRRRIRHIPAGSGSI